jgi:hypothetical protein
MTKPPPPATFQSILASANLPPPGPEYFAARRALWITPASRLDQTTSTPRIQREGLSSETKLVPLRTVVCLRSGLSPCVSGLIMTICF